MSDTFESSRAAAAYAYATRRGPQAARPSHGRGPKGYRSPWDGCAVRACMTRAGITPDSPEDRELEAWARGDGPKPTKVERRLRFELGKAGLLRERPQVIPIGEYVIKTWQDPETGATTESLAYEPKHQQDDDQ